MENTNEGGKRFNLKCKNVPVSCKQAIAVVIFAPIDCIFAFPNLNFTFETCNVAA